MGLFMVIVGTLTDFGRSTSIAGINNAATARSWTRSMVWLVVFGVCLYQTVTGLISVVEDFFDYPYITDTVLSHKTAVEFPAVTFCNLNRVNCDHLLNEKMNRTEEREILKDSGGSQEEINALTTVIHDIDEIFRYSGCMEQICTSIYTNLGRLTEDIGNDVEITPDEELAILGGNIGCSEDIGAARQNGCPYLLVSKEKASAPNSSISADDKDKIDEGWANLGCNNVTTCQSMTPRPGDNGNDMSQYVPETCKKLEQEQRDKELLNSSSEDADGTTDTDQAGPPQVGQGRKKRALNDESPSSSSLGNIGPPTADAYNDAEFDLLYLKLTKSLRQKVGHRIATFPSSRRTNITGFLSSCSYRSTDCSSPKYWQIYQSAGFGNCITFNSVSNEADSDAPRKATLTGVSNGLTVELFLDQENYMLKKLSKKAGIRMVLHDPYLPPLPEDNGLDLMPNTASSISIQRTEISRLTAPYASECYRQWDETPFDVSNKRVNYSLAICQRYCLQRAIIAECDCFHPNLVLFDYEETAEGDACYTVPDPTSSVLEDEKKELRYLNFTCFQRILNAFDDGDRACPCHTLCNETEFSSLVTISTWPSNQYWRDLALDLGYDPNTVSGPPQDSLKIKESIQQNFVQANIYYKTLNVKSVTQNKKYEGNAIVSSLGGALSLYLGMAVIMCFEILELILDLFINLFDYCNGGAGKKLRR